MSRRVLFKAVLYVSLFLLLIACLIYSGLRILESTVYSNMPANTEEWESKTLSVDGIEYFPRQDITVVMALGIDEDGPVQSSGSYRNHGEADAIMLLILDHAAENIDILCLNRDTIAPIPVLGIGGRVSDTIYAQLALSHTYGEGLEDSCENTQRAVSTLLNDIVIDHYVAMNMAGIGLVNDAVGGVRVNVTDDFSQVDSSLKMGEVTLSAQQALSFVQTRKDVGNQLNISRMERHREYMKGLMQAISAKSAESDTFAAELYDQVSDYVVSNCSVNVISSLMNRCGHYSLDEIVSPAGQNVLGEEYYEFYVDEEALDALVLRLFYAPK